ncbi:hypothetical protein NORO109296_19175 [Nocardiopsis rhodophaea]
MLAPTEKWEPRNGRVASASASFAVTQEYRNSPLRVCQ